jgi:hypothetical protein
MTKEDAQTIIASYSNSNSDQQGFLCLYRFLLKNPEMFGWRGKAKPNLDSRSGVIELAEKYIQHKSKKSEPTTPTTIPDTMVGTILVKYYSYKQEHLDRIKQEHQHSMVAENLVGEMLERYIESVLSTHGWHWCPAALIKHVDFIKLEGENFRLLQIKNRDNSENSSSKAIRDGTEIEKWFRTFSKTGRTNWEAFPDAQLRHLLSEKGFIEYVKAY